MLIKEYFIVLREVWYKCKSPMRFDWIIIKEKNQEYIKSFNFYNYLKKNIFNSNIFINVIYFITLYFFLKILYDFFLFLWYTIDLIINFVLKWFFYIIYASLDKWEGYIFNKIYELRKNPVKLKKYKREKGLLANSRAKFFKRFINPLEKDLDTALKLNKRTHSVIMKYYKYFSIWIPSLWKSIKFSLRVYTSRLNIRLNIKPGKIYREKKIILKIYIKIYFYKLLKILAIFINESYIFYRKYILRGPFLYLHRKFFIFLKAYKLRKEIRLKYYTFLYINYFFYYKKRSKMENFFSMLSEEELIKYTDQAMLLTFNFYSFNFKWIYIWHFYIRRIPYLTYLERRYKKLDRYNYTLAMDYKHSWVITYFLIIWFFEFWCRNLPIIIPIFDKYYVKYVSIIIKYTIKIFYDFFSFLVYIITFPFIFIAFCYKGLKGFFKYFIIFLKELFK